jgi:hypothetical protein
VLRHWWLVSNQLPVLRPIQSVHSFLCCHTEEFEAELARGMGTTNVDSPP